MSGQPAGQGPAQGDGLHRDDIRLPPSCGRRFQQTVDPGRHPQIDDDLHGGRVDPVIAAITRRAARSTSDSRATRVIRSSWTIRTAQEVPSRQHVAVYVVRGAIRLLRSNYAP